MRLLPALVALAALLAFAAPARATDVSVTLEITYGSALAPGVTTCAVSVPAGANAGDVLDAATARGCIGGWQSQSFEGFGRFVTCITTQTQICQVEDGLVTFWEYVENGVIADHGIDGYHAADGGDVKLVYTNFEAEPAPLLAGLLP